MPNSLFRSRNIPPPGHKFPLSIGSKRMRPPDHHTIHHDPPKDVRKVLRKTKDLLNLVNRTKKNDQQLTIGVVCNPPPWFVPTFATVTFALQYDSTWIPAVAQTPPAIPFVRESVAQVMDPATAPSSHRLGRIDLDISRMMHQQ